MDFFATKIIVYSLIIVPVLFIVFIIIRTAKGKNPISGSNIINWYDSTHSEEEDLLDKKAPYLVPYYIDFKNNSPKLVKDGEELIWKFKEKYYSSSLYDKEGKQLTFFADRPYIHLSENKDKFIIWRRSDKEDTNSCTINISLYATKDLQPISKGLIGENKSIINALPQAQTTLSLSGENLQFKVDLPQEFKEFGEFLIVAEIPRLYTEGQANYSQNTAIISVDTINNLITVYPQDWFNKDGYDYGYQWITRAVRNSQNGKILVSGIRISVYELDETGRSSRIIIAKA